MNTPKERILVLDFGSQYSQLIARRVRELGVYCELHAYDMSPEAIAAFAPSGIILSGGPETVTLSDTPRAATAVFELGCPILGICYGMQTMALQLGGQVEAAGDREFGYAKVVVDDNSVLFQGIADGLDDKDYFLDVWMSHGDHVTAIPPGFSVIGQTDSAPIAAMADETRHFYGVQFHPEVTHTRQGQRLLSRFLHEICGLVGDWDSTHIIDDKIEHIRAQVGQQKVLLGLSGGVDSSVVAALLHKAIGKQLICVFVDTGLLREHEATTVMDVLGAHLGVTIIHVEAATLFLESLKGVSDPEEKRKIIGRLFVEIFEAEADKLTDVIWLAQGTIYSDVIESAASHTNKAHVIKSHHNVGGLPSHMRLKLLEPVRDLFKDEVRKLGLELGLPYEWVHRHPFPGPGLGVRILGEVKAAYVTLLKRADAIFMEELRKSGWYEQVSQAFAVFLPVKSVGVIGDARQYDYVVALRAVQTVDFMTAHWAELPYELLGRISNRIINEVRGIARVVYDISGKPPATIEWE